MVEKTEIQILREQLAEVQQEIRSGFQDIAKWRRDIDTATMGLATRGIWGYQQKIEYNKKKITALEKRQTKLELTFQKHLGIALGIGAVGGSTSAVIFNLIIKLLP